MQGTKMLAIYSNLTSHKVVTPEAMCTDDLSVCVASEAAIAEHFPRTMYEQPDIAPIVRSADEHYAAAEEHDAEGLARTAQEIEVQTDYVLETARGLRALVEKSLGDLGLSCYLAEPVVARAKSAERAAEKAGTKQAEGDLRPITDMAAARIVLTDEVAPEFVLEQLQIYFGVPDEYPGGIPAVKRGGRTVDDNPDSDEQYEDVKLIVAVERDGCVIPCEIKIQTIAQAVIDEKTRHSYNQARRERFYAAAGRAAFRAYLANAASDRTA